jgi:thiol-disulfide isomerase/thioredoxin
MKRRAFLALGFVAIAFIGLSVTARRVPTLRAAAATTTTAQPTQKRGATNSQAGKRVVVREIDLEGLKKLFQRDGKRPRPLLVNFWATYCEPCREEFPDLVEIDKDYRGRGLEFITVSLDDAGEIKTGVPQFLRQMRAWMPAFLLNVPDPEPAIKWIDQAWGGGLPATYLYDAQGQVVFKHMGRVKPAELRQAIETVTSDK